ncbi:MAG TPA: galactokinase [Gaiellaceae bacterium]|nr:galactokinase [Gaiellaceae bacterium]
MNDERWFRAPGRVNLIGDHTDYNEGFVLPVAIDLGCTVRAKPRPDGLVKLRSLDVDSEVELAADGSTEPAAVEEVWGRYAAGVIGTLAALGRPAVGMDGVISSTIPLGAGLSSSAALEVSLALALNDVAEFELSAIDVALACQKAEQDALGVPVGIMDQLASVAGKRNHALLIDCRSLDVAPIPVPSRLAVLIVHCGVSRALVDSAYAERRQACEAAAARLGLKSLRDATPEQVADDPRARHVVSENARVLQAARALEAGDVAALGPLLNASHESLRNDYEVSTPELDALVEALVDAGAIGARLTGAGFGGCVVGLAGRDAADEIVETAAGRYWAQTGHQPRAFVFRAVDGAGRVPAQTA